MRGGGHAAGGVDLLESVQPSIQKQLLYINVELFRGRLVFWAHRVLYHSILGLIGMKRKQEEEMRLAVIML